MIGAKMKDNIWKKGFKTDSFTIKDLSLENNLELAIIKDEVSGYWTKKPTEPGKEITILDIAKVKEDMASGKITELLQRTEKLLQEIIDDEDFLQSIQALDIFFVIPSLYLEIRKYKESLKKK